MSAQNEIFGSVLSCYEFPLYFYVLCDLVCFSLLIFSAYLIGYRRRYLRGSLWGMIGFVGFYLWQTMMLFGNPLIGWDLGFRALIGKQSDAAQHEAEYCMDHKHVQFHDPIKDLLTAQHDSTHSGNGSGNRAGLLDSWESN